MIFFYLFSFLFWGNFGKLPMYLKENSLSDRILGSWMVQCMLLAFFDGEPWFESRSMRFNEQLAACQLHLT